MGRAIDGQDECQGGYGHAFYDIDFDYRPAEYYELWVTQKCDRCPRLRVRVFDPEGNSHLRYPTAPGWRKHNVTPDLKLKVAKARGQRQRKSSSKATHAKVTNIKTGRSRRRARAS